jgi:hypothetical protein
MNGKRGWGPAREAEAGLGPPAALLIGESTSDGAGVCFRPPGQVDKQGFGLSLRGR